MTQDAPLHVRAAQHFATTRRLTPDTSSNFDTLVQSKLGVVSFRSGPPKQGISVIGAGPELHAVVELNTPIFGVNRFYVKPGKAGNIKPLTDQDMPGRSIALKSFDPRHEELMQHVINALNEHAPKPKTNPKVKKV